MATTTDIADRIFAVRETVARAAQRGRGQDVLIVAVSKTVSPGRVLEAYRAGQRTFGENRVQEATDKLSALAGDMPDASWHLIGHLQTNKARAAIEAFSLIESVDTVQLAQRLDRLAGEAGRRLPVLLEVNVAGEEQKAGFAPDDLLNSFLALAALHHLELRGLMTVAPLVNDPEEARPVFCQLRELRDQIQGQFGLSGCAELSMGMSNDFEVAVEEGATMVRIGRALFGERPVR